MATLTALAIFTAVPLSHAVAQSPAAAQPPAAKPAAVALPDGPGKSVTQRACASCHGLGLVTSKRASPDGWTQVVDEMVNRGADLSDDEIDTVIGYLSANFGVAGSKNGPSSSPEVAGQPASPDKAERPSSSIASTPPASVPLNKNKAGNQ